MSAGPVHALRPAWEGVGELVPPGVDGGSTVDYRDRVDSRVFPQVGEGDKCRYQLLTNTNLK